MKETLEKLWHEYFSDKCSVINTDEERRLSKIALELEKKFKDSMSKEQEEAVNQYINALYDLEELFLKKAFYMGCEFAVSFLWETQNLED